MEQPASGSSETEGRGAHYHGRMVTRPDADAEWWTTSDVAAFLGIQVGTVSSYRNRGQMPEPDRTEGRTHLWRPARITEWHESRPRPGIGGRPGADIDDEGQGAEAAATTLGAMTGFVEVSTATDSREAAQKLARSAVEARLVAGAQIVGPVETAFWHLGEFGTGQEWRLLLKTHIDRFNELEAHLLERHPWKNPEISAVPIVAGSEGYLDWIRRTTEADPEA